MIARAFSTGTALFVSTLGFFGGDPSTVQPLNPFGIVFLVVSGVVWLGWDMFRDMCRDAYAYREEICPNQGHVFLQTERLGPALVDRLIRK